MATVYNDAIARGDADRGGLDRAHGLTSWVARKVTAWRAARQRARELQDLAMFSDRDLWDVGLSRSDLMALEKGVYKRD